jgi:PII-like signaling protein
MDMTEAARLMIYIGEADRYERKRLYHAIVDMLRTEGIAGATVLHGIEGYGASRHMHTIKILDLSSDLPVVIIAIDSPQKIEAIAPQVDAMVAHGLVTVERVSVVGSRFSLQ